MATVIRILVLTSAASISLAGDAPLYGQQPVSESPEDAAVATAAAADDEDELETSKDDADRPLVLPPKTRPRPPEQSLEHWIEQLGHNQYLRREEATRQLVQIGTAAIPAIVQELQRGDLEMVERAMSVITEIAIARAPSEDGGAWEILNDLAATTSGVRSARAEAAIGEVRATRSKQARKALEASGIFVGLTEFVVRSMSEPRTTVEIDESWSGDVTSLQWLRWLDGIEFARVKGPAIRQDVLQQVVTIPDLKTLVITDGTVDERTLEPLKSMSRITSLEFRYVPLTPELCDMIAGFPIRLSLNLMGTGISGEKVEQMRAALPGLIIDHKQGGFLGVVCYDNTNVCEINRVVEDSAAQAAGLLSGDVIVAIGDAEVTKFRDLQEAINQHLPGDEIEVKYVRGNQIETVSLRLRRLEDQ